MEDVGNLTGKHRPKARHHGHGTIIRRADHWRAEPWVWMLRGIDESGKRRVLASCSGASKAECERRAKDLLRELARGSSVDAVTMSVAEQLDRWLLTVQANVRKPRTYERYRSTVNVIRPKFEDIPIGKLDVRETRDRLVGTPNQRAYGLFVLRMAMKAAVSEKIIPSDPTAGLRISTPAARQAPVVDADMAITLLNECESDPYGPLVILAVTMGLRRGELLALRWRDVDRKAGTLRVEWNLQRVPVEFRDKEGHVTEAVPPKNNKVRMLPLSSLAADALDVQAANVKTMRREAKVWAENDLVFPDANGQPIYPNTATRKAEALIRRVIPEARLHDMRAAWETLLASGGVGEHIRMKLAGHSTISQTMDYTKVVPADARRAVAILDEALAR